MLMILRDAMQRGLGYQYNGVGIDGGCQQAIGKIHSYWNRLSGVR